MQEGEINNRRYVGKILSIVICMILAVSAMGGLIGVASNVQDRESGTQPALNAVTVLDSDRDLTVLTLRCSGLIEGSIIANDEVFTTLSFPGLDHIGSIGKPQLPYASAHVAVPNGLVTATVTNDEYYETDVGLVYPAQSPDPDLYVEEEPKFAFDQITYTTNAFYPNDVILLVEQGEVRGIPFSVVGFNPVQYNPVTGIARVHTRIDVDLTWDGSVPFRMEEQLKSKYFMDYYENAFQNWESFEKTFSDELASESSTPKGPNGCEYLIIVDPAFVNAADTLATWKLERGIDTRVVDTTETGITQPEIAAYILDAYTNWTPAPSYVLLFGDADHINTNYVNVHPYHGTITGTDLWYYTLDGPDYFADMFYGRIPVDTTAQADNYINKIVDYEIDPPYNSEYYNNVTVAAYFQDPGLDGTEDRRFVRTSEEVRDYLMNNQTYDVERIYVTEASVTPTNYNDGNYWWPISGEPIPADLLRANGFPWDGGATEIKSRVDSGTFILNHRDHGSREGWGDPFFQIPEVGTLDNGDLLPIVYSINCMTGWFDHETDDPADGTSTECFSEEFLRKVDGGCVCIFGASRVSYSGYNDFLCRGWYDAVWTDFDLSIGSATPMYRMGEQLNYGKWYMANHYAWGDPWGYAELTSELFHVYGDPTMEMWTAEPMSMVVSHPPSYPFGTTQITVNVSEDGAFVSLVQDGEIIGTDYSIGGDAIVDVNPLLGGVVSVTVTKHNFRPYRGSIIVPSGPHDIAVKNLNVPPTGVAGVAVNVDADIFNLGTNDEPNVEVQLLVDGFMEDSTTIPFIASGNIDPVTLSWTPMFGGNYFVEMYAIPVAGENVTWNNIMNDTIFIVAYPDIWVSPGGFDFVLQAGEEDQDILTIGNSGLANLDFNIVTLQGGDSVFEDFPDLVWNPAIWDTASFTGIPEINTLGVNEPSAPNTMELDGDGDTVFSVIYDTTASDSLDFEFYYELGGGGEAPDATDGLALEYYTSGGAWVEAWSVNGDGTLHSSFDHASVDIIAADAYHGGFQYRFRSWGSGATFDDFYVDDIYFNYTVPVTDGWLQVVPETGVLPPLSSTTVDVIVNATTLSPGFHQSNITVINNDPDENPILVPVNVTVLSAPHDVAVLDMTVEGSFEAGKTLWINGTIINQGLLDETNVDVQFMVDFAFEDSTTIASLPSSNQDNVYFTWVPPLGINYTLTLYTVPVPGDTITVNNWMNETVEIFALPDIDLSPMSFEFAVPPDQIDTDILTVQNDGLADLDWEILMTGPQGVVINEFYTGADWAELYNYGPPVDMSGWTWFWNDMRNYSGIYTIPAGFVLDTYNFVVLDEAAGTNTATTLYMNQNMMWTSSSGGIAGEIRDASGNGVDFFRTAGDTTVPTAPGIWNTPDPVHPNPDGSGARHDDSDDDDGNDWTVITGGAGTSGALNPGQTGIGSAPCSWLTVNPDNGITGPLSQDLVTLTVNTTGLTPGFYQTNLTVMSNDPVEGIIMVPVNLTVATATTTQVSVQVGWNFISIPLIPMDSSMPAALTDQLGDTNWTLVMWFDPLVAGSWKTYSTFKPPSFNDLLTVNHRMGVWVYIPNAAALGDGILELAGVAPTDTSINLYTGWNLVGYPSATSSLASATLPPEADMVSVCDMGQPYYIRDELPAAVTMSEGNAYWVRVTANCIWTVTY